MNYSCDFNKANIFFLQTQNKINIQIIDGNEFRYYSGLTENRKGWLFPSEIQDEDSLKPYLEKLLSYDSNPRFILLVEEQKDLLESCINRCFKNYEISFSSDEGDSDYLYSVEKMAELPGKLFQKKRNHVSRFLRTYENNWKFEFFNCGDQIIPDLTHIKKIYTQWKQERNDEENDFLRSEEKSITLALDETNYRKLKLLSGILYVNDEPSAFAIASFTDKECLNIHFEKCVEDIANKGALAFLNQQLAEAVRSAYPECKYLNREEDLNIAGLRKSKKSYQPELMLKKYYGNLQK